MVDDITDRTVELDKAFPSVQIIADDTNTDFEKNQKDRKHLLHRIRQSKSKVEDFLTEIN